jgi:hypothetical protein
LIFKLVAWAVVLLSSALRPFFVAKERQVVSQYFSSLRCSNYMQQSRMTFNSFLTLLNTMPTKYSPKAGRKVQRAMHEMKQEQLKSGRSGKKVTSRQQAIAIGLSEARRAGAKVPKKKR